MMKRILKIFAVVLLAGLLCGCGGNSEFKNELLSGNFKIDGVSYSKDNLHNDLIKNNYTFEDDEDFKLFAKGETIFSYLHGEYGFDFCVDAFHYNDSDKEQKVLDCPTRLILIKFGQGSKKPTVEFGDVDVSNSTYDDIKKLASPDESGSSYLVYKDSSAIVKSVRFSFYDDNKIKSIELSYDNGE